MVFMMKFLSLLFLSLLVFSPYAYSQSSFYARVVKIIDGDSIVIKKGKDTIEIRLYGIDCPEWNQHFSTEAKKYMKSMIYKKKVWVESQYYDSYGRLVALIDYNDKNINGKMVESGMAWVYTKYCRKNICRDWMRSQQSAKVEKRGLWKMESPISPWRWKRMAHD